MMNLKVIPLRGKKMSCGLDRRKIEFIHHCVGRGGIRKHACHTSRRPDEIPSEAADSLAILASTAGARHRTRPAPLPPRSKASKLRFHNNRHSRQRSACALARARLHTLPSPPPPPPPPPLTMAFLTMVYFKGTNGNPQNSIQTKSQRSPNGRKNKEVLTDEKLKKS